MWETQLWAMVRITKCCTSVVRSMWGGGGLQDCWPPALRLMHSGPSIAAGTTKGNWSVVKSPAAVANASGQMQAVCLSMWEAKVMCWCGVAVQSTIMGQ